MHIDLSLNVYLRGYMWMNALHIFKIKLMLVVFRKRGMQFSHLAGLVAW